LTGNIPRDKLPRDKSLDRLFSLQNADYLVVVELLSHPDGRTPASLLSSLGVEPETLDTALSDLEQDGVIVRENASVRLSKPAQRLDRMNLIAL